MFYKFDIYINYIAYIYSNNFFYKIFFCVPIRYRNTRESLGELQFLVLPNFHLMYNCMEIQKIFCFLFLYSLFVKPSHF